MNLFPIFNKTLPKAVQNFVVQTKIDFTIPIFLEGSNNIKYYLTYKHDADEAIIYRPAQALSHDECLMKTVLIIPVPKNKHRVVKYFQTLTKLTFVPTLEPAYIHHFSNGSRWKLLDEFVEIPLEDLIDENGEPSSYTDLYFDQKTLYPTVDENAINKIIDVLKGQDRLKISLGEFDLSQDQWKDAVIEIKKDSRLYYIHYTWTYTKRVGTGEKFIDGYRNLRIINPENKEELQAVFRKLYDILTLRQKDSNASYNAIIDMLIRNFNNCTIHPSQWDLTTKHEENENVNNN